ncbi:MAG: alpha/beta hydrolase [Oscillatoriaceae cyanobacterium Prado104]|jgi:proline iminopeptidase|nr:alpha/beta hydrolase [Oscillatoriaceae cyanobacterium Prado104]
MPHTKLSVDVKGTGFPILCLHGHPGSGYCMSVFTEHLSKRFQTIAPDLRGYGKSRTSIPFEMTDHLLDLEALLDRFQINKCSILGWSLGGILALELAMRYPQRVAGLIVLASAAKPRGSHPPISWQDNFYTGVAGIINWAIPGWQWNIDTFGKRSLFRYLINQHTPTPYRYLAAAGTPAYLQTCNVATQALNTALRAGYNRLEHLGDIQCPALVLAGEGDRHITPTSSLETASHLPQCQWQCYPNTAHLFPWEIPDRVLADIDRWLDSFPQELNNSKF